MQKFTDFLMHMDARRWRVLLIGALALGGITALFMLTKQQFAYAEHDLGVWLSGYRTGVWGLFAAIVLFTLSAFVGAPQFILIALCVVAFGPWHGFAYSWIATIFSAGVTYWLGRGPAARLIDRVGGAGSERLRRLIGGNSFTASFVIRNVPSAPFIVVNAAFGAVRAGFWGYLAGCALGVLPKTAMIAFFGGSVVTAAKGDGVWSSLLLAGVAVLWLLLMVLVREFLKRRPRGGAE